MFWLAAVVVMLAALATVVAVALSESEADPAPWDPPPPDQGPVTPASLRRADLPLVRRGYDPGRVDALLERAAQQLEASPTASSGEELEEGGGDLAGGLDG